MKTMSMLTAALAAVGVVACAGAPARADDVGVESPGQAAFEFALIGDVPYNVPPNTDSRQFDNLVADINSDPRIEWVLHAGDIKAGSTPCTDRIFDDRLKRYGAFAVPFVITPGDNEWTDCHRSGYEPLERLARLRRVFFPEPGLTLGRKPMAVLTQAAEPGTAEFPENVLWSRNGVVFATMHMTGSRNGLAAFRGRTAADDAEVARRTGAALAWLDRAFGLAASLDSPGVFLMIHANPGLGIEPGRLDRTGFGAFLAALEGHVAAYGRPVVLAHGDSHYFRVDKPTLASGRFLANFTRVETFGAPQVHWVRVTVDTKTPEVFTIRQQIVEANIRG